MTAAARSIDHLLAAHVHAYAAIHAARGDAVVSINGFAFSCYGLEQLGNDVLLARHYQVPRSDLRTWLASRRNRYEATLPRERLLRALVDRVLNLDRALPRTIEAVYASEHACTLDHLQTDYYNPQVGSHFRVPGHRTAGGRHWGPDRLLWDDQVDPGRFGHYLQLLGHEGFTLWIVENGLCNRRRNGRGLARTDGWDRPRYLQAHLREVVAARDAGIPVAAYFHWTLADNYEWGSYEPAFGIYGVDRERGNRWSDTDSMGDASATAYRRLIEGITRGDRSVLTCPVADLVR